MTKTLLFCGLALAAATSVQAQALPDRYRSNITSSVTTTTGVAFSTNIPQVSTSNVLGFKLANEQTYGNVRATLRMDIYQPQGDTLSKRPVIIFCFGGGFVNGSRTDADMVALARSFAQRGFVTASIDYRLGMNLTDPEKAKRAVYRALQDGRSAVRFFRNNARTYRVDPNQVFISGHSAGAFIACNNAYVDREAERPAATYAVNGLADLGALDAIGDNRTNAQGQAVSGKANAVLSFAGAVVDPNHIEGPNDVPVALFHSINDPVVLYNTGKPFAFLDIVPGFNLPVVYGSNPINTRANAVNAPHLFYSYSLRGHDVHYSRLTFPKFIYSDIAPRGSDFFYNYRLKPATATISGPATVCSGALTKTYSVGSSFGYCDWQATGGTIVARNAATNSVTVAWSGSTTTRRLTATPYSRQLAKGLPVSLTVSLGSCPTLSRLADNSLAEATKTPATRAFGAYPNPTTGQLHLQLDSELEGAVSIRLLDKFGAVRARAELTDAAATSEQSLDLSALPAGVYYVQVTTAQQVLTRRVVKE
ncbi:carboxylesterase family protein [Hymenobacter sp. IS2118]|uniref:carboxylesterase family protein n=1 Tax=Hymenobacter sp. IS2118 TaxID=1505605 RepID=UPI0005533A6D|nr:carboxylesterase family protein [Hymenobacter sp. IS2118]